MPECPLCGDETGHVNNHVRMKSGGEHGPQGQYPDGWDVETSSMAGRTTDAEADGRTDSEGSDPVDDSGEQDAGAGDTPDVEAADAEPEPESGTVEDPAELDPDDEPAKEYECAGCGEALDYLQKKCGGCGKRPAWAAIEGA